MRSWVLAVAVVLACDRTGSPRPVPPTHPANEAPPGSPSVPPPEPPRPVAVPLDPFACHAEPDLPPLAAEQGHPSACDGIGPLELGRAIEATWESGSFDWVACAAADGDGAGNVAAAGFWFYVGETLLLWNAAGSRIPVDEVPRPAAVSVIEGIAGGPTGFAVDGLFAEYRLAGDGSLTSFGVVWPLDLWAYIGHSYEAPYSAVPDGNGGLLTVAMGSIGHRAPRYALMASHIQADGRVDGPWTVLEFEWDPPPPSPPFALHALNDVAIGAAGDGRVLVVWRGDLADAACGPGTLVGRWFEAGVPDGPVFLAGTSPRRAFAPVLMRLADGSLVFGRRGVWERRFVSGVLAGGPPPAWLEGRVPIAVARGGRATAIVSAPDGFDPFEPEIALVARDGQTCTRARLPLGSAIELPTAGFDGTLIQVVGNECPGRPEATSCCTYRWWPRGLRE